MSLDRDEFKKRRRAKNLAVGLGLAVLCLLFYLLTIVKLTGNVH